MNAEDLKDLCDAFDCDYDYTNTIRDAVPPEGFDDVQESKHSPVGRHGGVHGPPDRLQTDKRGAGSTLEWYISDVFAQVASEFSKDQETRDARRKYKQFLQGMRRRAARRRKAKRIALLRMWGGKRDRSRS